MSKKNYINVLQITDTHFREKTDGKIYGIETQILFEKTLAQIQSELAESSTKVDVLLATGDISQDGSKASYSRFHNFLKPLAIPSYYLQGNHDYHEPMVDEFGEANIAPCFVSKQHLNNSPWNIVLLNSSVEGQVGGHFGSEQLHYLEQRLAAAPEAPTMICFHHHPFSIACEWLDKQQTDDADVFFKILEKYSNVKLGIYGHIHQDRKTEIGQVSYFSTPSTCAQFKPEVNEFALDENQPAYRWIRLYDDGRFETEVRRLKSST